MVQQTNLCFAALIRVSTEKQQKEGESLRTQKRDIELAVGQLGGKVVAWYGGQEHATPGFEKKEVHRLVQDAQSKSRKFDCVIVTDADRWSRDNAQSRHGLDVFKQHGVRFFIGTLEQDLLNEDHRLFLGISAEIGQFFATKQKRKSIINRIARAKRGIPTGGKIPYGRIFTKTKDGGGKWSIDKEKQAIIEDCAKRYLAGENIVHLAEEYGINYTNLHKTLMHRSGEDWQIEFYSEEFKINEVVKIKVPRLLPDSIIKKLHKRCKANKTFTHGKIKNAYLLSRMIFCDHCGYALSGLPNHGNRRYRHVNGKRVKPCSGKPSLIDAQVIEDAVIKHLFECFGNPKAVERALERAMPNLDKIKSYYDQLSRHQTKLDQVQTGRDKVVKWAVAGKLSDAEAEKQLDELNADENRIKEKIEQINQYLQNLPNPQNIKNIAKIASDRFTTGLSNARRRAITKKINADFEGMTYEEKRALVELVFSGERPDGSRMGVYVRWENGQWRFSIHGHLIDVNNQNPLTEWDLGDGAGYDQSSVTKYALH